MDKSIHRLKINNTLVIVFANSSYLPVLNNWLIAVDRLGITNFLIIALDEQLFTHLESRHVPAILKNCDPNLESLWIHRILVLKEILETGCSVIHSDADAVWLKNPLEKFIYGKPYDMIFSQGTVWPYDVHEIWKFVLCCGFFFVHSNKVTLQFVNDLAIQVRKDQDDQVSINRLLLGQRIKWKTPIGYPLCYRDKQFLCYDDIIVGENENLSVALLPHAKFQRIRDRDDDVYVKHILSAKNADNILQVLQENNCLLIEQ